MTSPSDENPPIVALRISESPELDKLAGALSKASLEFDPVVKDRTANVRSEKGNYSYNYADLASVLRAVTPALSKHGLVLVQRPMWDPNLTSLSLESRLLHESGQWLAGSYPLPTASRPQEMGSALTYARRYSATSLLGIASEEDDDANAAEGNEATHEPKQSASAKDPLNADILETAKKLAEAMGGKSTPENFIKDASAFDGDDGPRFFTDPRKAKSEKWKKGTLTKLTKKLESITVANEELGQEQVPF